MVADSDAGCMPWLRAKLATNGLITTSEVGTWLLAMASASGDILAAPPPPKRVTKDGRHTLRIASADVLGL